MLILLDDAAPKLVWTKSAFLSVPVVPLATLSFKALILDSTIGVVELELELEELELEELELLLELDELLELEELLDAVELFTSSVEDETGLLGATVELDAGELGWLLLDDVDVVPQPTKATKHKSDNNFLVLIFGVSFWIINMCLFYYTSRGV